MGTARFDHGRATRLDSRRWVRWLGLCGLALALGCGADESGGSATPAAAPQAAPAQGIAPVRQAAEAAATQVAAPVADRAVSSPPASVGPVATPAAPGWERALAPLPQNDGRTHLGASSCSGPVCHTSSEEPARIYGDEWFVWHEDDRHSQAYAVLKNDASKRIARNMGYGKPAWEVKVCLDCHAHNVPEAKRGAKFKISAGVSCEACHGGSDSWASKHDNGRPHAQNVADGMYPADEPVARAALCTSCHYGNKDKFVTHRIMGAGHPRMSFELQVFTNIQPAHFQVDDDYRERGKQAAEGTKVWAIGQMMSVRASLDALLDPKRSRDGVWPELVLFDCYACHHPMSDLRWLPKKSTARLGPGLPRLNDSSFLMARYVLGAVDPGSAKAFEADLKELHLAASASENHKRKVASRMRQRADAVIPRLEAWKVDATAVRKLLRAILGDGQAGEFLDYAGAEQASLAAQALFENLYKMGNIDQAKLEKVGTESDKLLEIIKNPEKFSPTKAKASFGRLKALAG